MAIAILHSIPPRNFKFQYRLLKQLSKIGNMSVFVIVDSLNQDEIRQTTDGVYFVSLMSETIFNLGQYYELGDLSGGNNPSSAVTSWDKSFFFFTYIATQFEYIWFLEYDVFIPSIDAFLHVHNKSMIEKDGRQYDLVTQNSISSEIENISCHGMIKDYFPSPHFWSYAFAVRLSRKYLSHLSEYVARNRRLHYLEVLFNTFAYHSNLSILILPELASPGYKEGVAKITCDDVNRNPLKWYHPGKSVYWSLLENCAFY